MECFIELTHHMCDDESVLQCEASGMSLDGYYFSERCETYDFWSNLRLDTFWDEGE